MKKPFTVISFQENTYQSFADHVMATNGITAFHEVAKQRNSVLFVVALPGHLTEGAGELIFPGEKLVDSETVLSQPEVFAETKALNNSCPTCHEDTALLFDNLEQEGHQCSQEVLCQTCGTEWTDHYEATRQVITKPGNK